MSIADQQKSTFRFGEFELDNSGELRSGGRKVKLQTQPSQILRILIERPGEIVTREELRQKIWPSDTFVDFKQGIKVRLQEQPLQILQILLEHPGEVFTRQDLRKRI